MATIEEIKAKRDDMQKQINKLLADFQEKYKVDLDIDFNYNDLWDDKDEKKDDIPLQISNIEVKL